MADHIYDIKKPWRGDNTIVEASNSNYIPEGGKYSDKAAQDALASLTEALRPIFGQDTEWILSDPEAAGDFDRDGYIDLNVKYIFDKYTSSGFMQNAPASWRELKEKLLSQPFRQMRFTEHFRDSLWGEKRPAQVATFPFPRDDVKAAADYFNTRFGGDALKDPKELEELNLILGNYLKWAAVHSIEDLSDNVRINANDGLTQFSKNIAGQSRIDCGGFRDIAETILSGIKDDSGKPAFSFSHVKVTYREADDDHVALIASASKTSKSIFVNNAETWVVNSDQIDCSDRGVCNAKVLMPNPKQDNQVVTIEDGKSGTVATRWKIGASIHGGFLKFVERLHSGIPSETLADETIEWARVLAHYIRRTDWQSDMPKGEKPENISAAYIEVLARAASETRNHGEKENFLAAAREVSENTRDYPFAKSLLSRHTEIETYASASKKPEERADSDFKTIVANITPESESLITDLAVSSGKLSAKRLAKYFLGDGDDVIVGMIDSPVIGTIAFDLIDKMNPYDGRQKFFTLIGRGMEARSRHDMAAKYFRRALDMWPRGAKGYSAVALATVRNMIRMEDEDGAKILVDKIMANGHAFRTWNERLDLAGIFDCVGKHAEAFKILKKIPRRFMYNPEYAIARFENAAKIAAQVNKALYEENVRTFVGNSLLWAETYYLKGSNGGFQGKHPGDGLRHAAHLYRLGETMVKHGYGAFAHDLFQTAERWDPTVSGRLDKLFGSEDAAPEWERDDLICSDGGKVRRCEIKDIENEIAKAPDRNKKASLIMGISLSGEPEAGAKVLLGLMSRYKVTADDVVNYSARIDDVPKMAAWTLYAVFQNGRNIVPYLVEAYRGGSDIAALAAAIQIADGTRLYPSHARELERVLSEKIEEILLHPGLSTETKMFFLNGGYRFKSVTRRIATIAKERKSEIAKLDPSIGTLISDILNFRRKWLASL